MTPETQTGYARRKIPVVADEHARPKRREGGFIGRRETCRLWEDARPETRTGDDLDTDHWVPGVGAYVIWAGVAAVFFACYATQPWSIPATQWNFAVEPIALWAGSVALILALFMLLGWTYNRTWKGIIVNDRNMLSASRLQAVIWSAVLLGTALALFLMRLRAGDAAPLGFDLPNEVVGLAGVSVGSLAAAAGVQQVRKGRQPTGHEVLRRGEQAISRFETGYTADVRHRARVMRDQPRVAAQTTGPGASLAPTGRVAKQLLAPLDGLAPDLQNKAIAPEVRKVLEELDDDKVVDLLDGVVDPARQIAGIAGGELQGALVRAASLATFKHDAQGTLYANKAPCEARFSDMLEGDELANAASLDFGKVQMLGFTLLTLGAYIAVLWQAFSGDPCAAGCPAEFPALSRGLVEVLGVSQLGYLGYKVAGPTQTG